jgi:hypothetical protein
MRRKSVPILEKNRQSNGTIEDTGCLVTKPKQNLEQIMRGALLWLVGIPIPIIILLYLFNVV